IDGGKMQVSKEFLAVHSPVLAKMFVGNDTQEVEIKAVDYEGFVSLLEVIFPGRYAIADKNVVDILKLGRRFEMERVLYLAETHLTHSDYSF
ncbi:hypothetical protein PENTCL1PPCAC_24780, partial [Pristionchus entomophagus]